MGVRTGLQDDPAANREAGVSDPDDERFGRRSEALGQALRELLVDVPDATPAEEAERVREVTSKLGEAWSEPPAEQLERAAGQCARCESFTRNGVVHWVTRNSGPDARVILHADPAECGRRRT